ncbi:MAG: hypothetical protein IPH72_34110 [Sandaracinaceae bacterium]|nr:hypothetical protein [Sandaracinaceae bacterium]
MLDGRCVAFHLERRLRGAELHHDAVPNQRLQHGHGVVHQLHQVHALALQGGALGEREQLLGEPLTALRRGANLLERSTRSCVHAGAGAGDAHVPEDDL